MQGRMTVSDAAQTLGVTGQRVRQLIAAGQLDAEKVGRSVWLVTEASVTARKEKAPEGAQPR